MSNKIRHWRRRQQAQRAMRSALNHGVNPYESLPAFATRWDKQWRDRQRRAAEKEARAD